MIKFIDSVLLESADGLDVTNFFLFHIQNLPYILVDKSFLILLIEGTHLVPDVIKLKCNLFLHISKNKHGKQEHMREIEMYEYFSYLSLLFN